MNIALQILIGFAGWIFIPFLHTLWNKFFEEDMHRTRLWAIFFVYCIFGPFCLMLPPVNGLNDND